MSKLHLNTISEEMQQLLTALMDIPELNHFRLVGGTSLALQLGHRISIDLDLFADGLADFDSLPHSLQKTFPNAVFLTRAIHGQTWSINNIKCDFFDWKVPFLNPPLEINNWRLASILDIAAYKLESYSERKSEKDFRDLAEILRIYSFSEILSAFRYRYPYIQTGAIIPILLKPDAVVIDSSLQLLNEKTLDQDAEQIRESIQAYESEIVKSIQEKAEAKDRFLRELIERKKK